MNSEVSLVNMNSIYPYALDTVLKIIIVIGVEVRIVLIDLLIRAASISNYCPFRKLKRNIVIWYGAMKILKAFSPNYVNFIV
jgi:uncharacterized protein YhhL (DUF1145 family)